MSQTIFRFTLGRHTNTDFEMNITDIFLSKLWKMACWSVLWTWVMSFFHSVGLQRHHMMWNSCSRRFQTRIQCARLCGLNWNQFTVEGPQVVQWVHFSKRFFRRRKKYFCRNKFYLKKTVFFFNDFCMLCRYLSTKKTKHCATTYYLMIEKKETVMKHEHAEKINSG